MPATPRQPMETPPAATPRPAPPDDDKPSLVLWHYKDPRLQSQQQVQETADKNFSFLAAYRPRREEIRAPGGRRVRQVNLDPEQKFAMGMDIREYELKATWTAAASRTST